MTKTISSTNAAGVQATRPLRVVRSFPTVRTYRLYVWAFLAAPLLSRFNSFATLAILFGCLLTVHLIASDPRLPWYGIQAIGISVIWLAYGALVGSVPAMSRLPDFISTEGRILVALIPLAGLAAARTNRAHFRVLERTFAFIAAFGGLTLMAWYLDKPVAGPRKLFFGFTSSHHAVAFVYAITLIALFTTRRGRSGWRFLLRSGLIGTCALIIVESGSRATLVGLVLGLVSTLAWRTSVDRLVQVAIAAVVGVVLVITFVPRASSTFNSLMSPDFRSQLGDVYDTGKVPSGGSEDDVNLLLRSADWGTALRNFTSSPVVGIGPWRFDDLVTRHAGIEGLTWLAVDGRAINSDRHAHNLYLHVLAETGVLGLILIGSLWIGLLVAVRRRLQSPHTPAHVIPWLRASWVGIVFGFGVSLTDIGLITPAMTFGLSIVIATTLGAGNGGETRDAT